MPNVKIPFIPTETPLGEFPINLYMQAEYKNGKNAMVGTPGLTARVSSMNVAPVRGMLTDKNRDFLYAVVGNTVYLIDKNWTATAASTTLDTTTGFVYMAHNLTQVMITDGTAGYIVTRSGLTPTVTKVTDTDMVTPSFLTMQDNYFIIGQKDSFNFQISAISDGTSWTATDLGTAEGNPDNITAGISDHRQLILFGPKSGEIFYNSGDSTFPFERFPDAFIENGIGAPKSLTQVDNSVFYLDQDFLVRRLNGFTPVVVSPTRLNQKIQALSKKDDAICFSYERLGNIFYVMTFPTANKTYVLNVGTGFVHQWAYGVNQDRHRANCYAHFNDKDLVGDHSNGKIYSLEDDVYTDDSATIKWTYTSPTYNANGMNIFFRELQIDFETGVGLTSGQGSDPQVMMRYSDDELKTWSNETWLPLGKKGKYKDQVVWRRIGTSPKRAFEMSGTDPVKRVFMEAYSDIEVENA
jgi:hypothetical protein